ncbi:MAG TPA: hypothetical protein VHE78_19105 [Gemmatimonadaceae bacterium]|nr:hypothetical protein [Gemmatimonadaceae bacterium]
MPLVPFSEIPDDARVWAFGSASPVDSIDAAKLLALVDAYLLQWKAHGHPLTCARAWRDERFLVIAVDQRTEGASGCSIDGLFRALRGHEEAVGTSIVAGGLVFFRDGLGLVHALARDQFESLAARGEVTATTPVFDTTVTTAADYRARFETEAGRSWHQSLLPGSPRR